MPRLLDEEVTAVYAGLRAATEHGDYVLELHREQRYVCLGGIRSTGLTASMAIAEEALRLLAAAGLECEAKDADRAARRHDAQPRRGLPPPLPGRWPDRLPLRAGHGATR